MIDCFSQRVWKLGHEKKLKLGPTSVIMGILNVTPDSFSDGGEYNSVDLALERAQQMASDGAHIIDVGGESTRPGAEPVSAIEEQGRVIPVIEALASSGKFIISVDTYRSRTAELAVSAGAHIINDVWGFQKDEQLASVAARNGSGVCAMHTGREREKAKDVISDQIAFLGRTVEILQNAAVRNECVVLDPGFGFAKTHDECAELLSRFEELHQLGYPLLVGTSRKRFIGHFTGREADDRDIGTAATSVVARIKGGAIFRVHDVKSNADALAIADAVITNGRE